MENQSDDIRKAQLRKNYVRMLGFQTEEEYEEHLRKQSEMEEQFRREQEERQRYRREQEEKARRNREHIRLQQNTISYFLSSGRVRFDLTGRIASQELYDLYQGWCLEKQVLPEPPRTLFLHLKNNHLQYSVAPSQNIPSGKGAHLRGYRGIRAATAEELAQELTAPEAAPHG